MVSARARRNKLVTSTSIRNTSLTVSPMSAFPIPKAICQKNSCKRVGPMSRLRIQRYTYVICVAITGSCA